jgi:hypothetical protein
MNPQDTNTTTAQTVNADDSAAIEALAKKLDATPEQVQEAIGAVGTKASDIELHLKGSRSTTNAERTASKS